MPNRQILFALRNVPGYLASGLRAFPKDARATVVTMPFGTYKTGARLPDGVTEINRAKLMCVADALSALGDDLPDVFVCCGWSDPLYLRLARALKRLGTKTVLAIDTPWRGGIRQFGNCLLSRMMLRPCFDFGWGSGEPQQCYLRKLGFSASRIKLGYYCADSAKFAAIGESRISSHRMAGGVRRFIFVGRYIPEKNMRRMERAFVVASERISREKPCATPWMLRCIGDGPLWGERTIHPRIEHLGYKAPAEIQNYVGECDAFVLPSSYEPWGVVVHEFALAGFPLLCSKNVQATTSYLVNGLNGRIFDPYDEEAMEKAFAWMMTRSDKELARMSEESHLLGLRYTTPDWVERVLSFAE